MAVDTQEGNTWPYGTGVGPPPGQLYRYKDLGFVTLVKLCFAPRGNGRSAISIQALRVCNFDQPLLPLQGNSRSARSIFNLDFHHTVTWIELLFALRDNNRSAIDTSTSGFATLINPCFALQDDNHSVVSIFNLDFHHVVIWIEPSFAL
ncbi:uncharacterized protein EAE98_006246 [Botrytis deweyae]|uniref:Uncharacterized protein n=1 Tax=Botrytis deweyae TaxID=2478750 RepID=A0ABQ7IKE2_9HELO|nr:uncharacterized protein EAE98_006246 [Botrytis deweyae]KAF7926862.1 hypothetical protein EAE98_006246 [Botrytis deweyae]